MSILSPKCQMPALSLPSRATSGSGGGPFSPDGVFLGPAEKPSLPDLKVARSDWTTLDKKGVNGWFGIMVCLKWWGTGLKFCAPKEQVELTEDWLRVMRDISAMLDGLLAHRASKK